MGIIYQRQVGLNLRWTF